VVAPGANELSTQVRYNHSDDTFVTLYGDDVDALNPATREGQQVTGVGGTLTLQTDGIRQVGGFKLELGQKFTFRDLEHGRKQLRSAGAADGSTHDEHVLAGYALLGRDVGRLSLQGGLRVEHTDTDLWFSEG